MSCRFRATSRWLARLRNHMILCGVGSVWDFCRAAACTQFRFLWRHTSKTEEAACGREAFRAAYLTELQQKHTETINLCWDRMHPSRLKRSPCRCLSLSFGCRTSSKTLKVSLSIFHLCPPNLCLFSCQLWRWSSPTEWWAPMARHRFSASSSPDPPTTRSNPGTTQTLHTPTLTRRSSAWLCWKASTATRSSARLW